MSYPSFPSIQKPSYDPSNSDDFPEWDDAVNSSKAAGYETTWPANTRLQMGHTYVWPAMPEADYQTLLTFIRSTINYAGAFVWTVPGTSTTQTMRLTTKPTAAQSKYGTWAVQLSMREM